MHQLQHPLSDKDKHRLEQAAKDIREGRTEDGMTSSEQLWKIQRPPYTHMDCLEKNI